MLSGNVIDFAQNLCIVKFKKKISITFRNKYRWTENQHFYECKLRFCKYSNVFTNRQKYVFRGEKSARGSKIKVMTILSGNTFCTLRNASLTGYGFLWDRESPNLVNVVV